MPAMNGSLLIWNVCFVGSDGSDTVMNLNFSLNIGSCVIALKERRTSLSSLWK